MRSFSGLAGIPDQLCSTCLGLGYYKDTRCLDGACAHRGRLEVVEEVRSPEEVAEAYKSGTSKTKKVVEKRKRVMRCPERPCPCPLGNERREGLKARAVAQFMPRRLKRSAR